MTIRAVITYYDTYVNSIVLELVYNVVLHSKRDIYHYLRHSGYSNVHPHYKLSIQYIK